MALREVVEADGRRDNEEAARQAKVLIRDKGSASPRHAACLFYETCTSVVTTQYPPIIIKVMNEAARALTSMR
jgi:hypothetical protein